MAILAALLLAATCALTLVAAAHARSPGCRTASCEQRVRVKWMRAIVAPYAQILDRIRRCETRGQPSPYRTNTGNGFYGAFQFDLQTWRSVGGRVVVYKLVVVVGPHTASALEQRYRAALLYKRRGAQPWPVCGR